MFIASKQDNLFCLLVSLNKNLIVEFSSSFLWFIDRLYILKKNSRFSWDLEILEIIYLSSCGDLLASASLVCISWYQNSVFFPWHQSQEERATAMQVLTMRMSVLSQPLKSHRWHKRGIKRTRRRCWGCRLPTSPNSWPNRVSTTYIDKIKLHPSRRKRKTEVTTVMDLQTLLRSTKRRVVDPLRKLMLIGGRVGSNWIFQNSQGACNPRNFWIGSIGAIRSH